MAPKIACQQSEIMREAHRLRAGYIAGKVKCTQSDWAFFLSCAHKLVRLRGYRDHLHVYAIR